MMKKIGILLLSLILILLIVPFFKPVIPLSLDFKDLIEGKHLGYYATWTNVYKVHDFGDSELITGINLLNSRVSYGDMNNLYARYNLLFTNKNVYLGSLKIQGADAETYNIINLQLQFDKNNIYSFNKILYSNYKDLQIIQPRKNIDKEVFYNVFSRNDIILKIDGKYYEYMGGENLKQINLKSRLPVYLGGGFFYEDCDITFKGKKLEGEVNTNFFEVLNRTSYGKDGKNVFYKENIISGADAKTFESAFGQIAKDKNHYYKGLKIYPLDVKMGDIK